MLELALLAIAPSHASTPAAEGELIPELVEGIDWSQPMAVRNALALALTLSATVGVTGDGRGIGVAPGGRREESGRRLDRWPSEPIGEPESEVAGRRVRKGTTTEELVRAGT